jgi:hypothetical protein
MVAGTVPNLTDETFARSEPVIVTVSPAPPASGAIVVNTGGGVTIVNGKVTFPYNVVMMIVFGSVGPNGTFAGIENINVVFEAKARLKYMETPFITIEVV